MDLNELRKIVRLMERAELVELEIEEEGRRVHLRRAGAREGAGEGPAPVVQLLPSGIPSAPPVAAPAAAPAPAVDAAASGGPPPGTKAFESPMVGTFYRSASPDADPFVEVGTRVDEDTVVCILEAMKVMNEIKAETRGEIVEVLVENGEPVEFGQPLFLLKA